MPDSEAARLYANSMSRVRQRVDLVQRVLGREFELGSEAFDAELVYLQFRKILEEIAFSSLAANKTEYSALHANFAKHWKAEKILQELENLNPNFYPQPLESPTSAPGLHHFEQLSSGFLTRDEFAACTIFRRRSCTRGILIRKMTSSFRRGARVINGCCVSSVCCLGIPCGCLAARYWSSTFHHREQSMFIQARSV
jgi:hypothetical protein